MGPAVREQDPPTRPPRHSARDKRCARPRGDRGAALALTKPAQPWGLVPLPACKPPLERTVRSTQAVGAENCTARSGKASGATAAAAQVGLTAAGEGQGLHKTCSSLQRPSLLRRDAGEHSQ